MFKMPLRVSEGVKDIAQHMIDYPRDWAQGEYWFGNLSIKNIKLSTAKGTSNIELYGNATLNTREKEYLADAIKQSIANRLDAIVVDQVEEVFKKAD